MQFNKQKHAGFEEAEWFGESSQEVISGERTYPCFATQGMAGRRSLAGMMQSCTRVLLFVGCQNKDLFL
jgi:hypothetical protein